MAATLILVIAMVILTKYNGRHRSDLKFKDNENLQIYTFDAGKADCMIIKQKEAIIMIDTGEQDLSEDLLGYLDDNHITKIDYLIITHFDKDHVGSAADVINHVTVDEVFQSTIEKESIYVEKYQSAIENLDLDPTVVQRDITLQVEDMLITLHGPEKRYPKNTSNNSSIITEIQYGETNLLLMADAQNDRIKDFLEANDKTYDILKVPYHGHYQKQFRKLVEQIQPKYSIITSSDEETEDTETLTILKENGSKRYLTRNGEIFMSIDLEGNVKVER